MFPLKYTDVKRQKLSNFPHQKVNVEAGDLRRPQDKKTKQKTKKQKNPVFKVTLPITQGSLLVERTSFSKDHLPSFLHSPTEKLGPSPPPAFEFFPDPQTVTCKISPGYFDSMSESTNLTSEYDLNSSADFTERTNEDLKQAMDEQWSKSIEDQNTDSKTNVISNAGLYVDNFEASKTYNAQAAQLNCEYTPLQGFMWPVDSKENERCAPTTYYQQQPQPPQYMTQDYFAQQQMLPSGYVQGGCMIPQVPQAGNSFSHNNSITLTDYSQSYAGFYTEHRASTEHYTSYQVSSSGWQTHDPASGQASCYGPCCVPPYPGTAFPNVTEPGSANTTFYPMSNYYSNHKYPC